METKHYLALAVIQAVSDLKLFSSNVTLQFLADAGIDSNTVIDLEKLGLINRVVGFSYNVSDAGKATLAEWSNSAIPKKEQIIKLVLQHADKLGVDYDLFSLNVISLTFDTLLQHDNLANYFQDLPIVERVRIYNALREQYQILLLIKADTARIVEEDAFLDSYGE